MMILDRANAPLIFWCYCLIHVIDCINVTAKKSLGWSTSSEILNGDTPDISAFRFHFWQPIEYFDPTAKYPDSMWKRGRFLGIAWDSSDQFTFKLWTEPDGNWKQGGELVRNIVRPIKSQSCMDADKVNPSDYARFKFKKKVFTRNRHRTGHKTIYKYTMQDLDDTIDADDVTQISDHIDGIHAVPFDDHDAVIMSEMTMLMETSKLTTLIDRILKGEWKWMMQLHLSRNQQL